MVLTETAYAKVNLALHVRRRRSDGYHDIESLFAFVDDGDVLRAEPRNDGVITLNIDGPFATGLDSGPDNLVMRAARSLPLSDKAIGANLHLTKNLPVASGIGGGSADAAAALRLLNRLWGCGLDDAALCLIAQSLGSDIPACVISRTLRVEGRGEALQPCDLPGVSGTSILLVNPSIALATGPVFQGWDQQDRGALDTSSLDAIIGDGRNDLEPSACALVPQIGDVIAVSGAQAGAALARMSGSGATCFALFGHPEAAQRARESIGASHPNWWMMAGSLR